MKADLSNWSTRILYLFLATDLVFISLHLIHIYSGVAPNPSFSLETDGGYAEIFQYIKEYWIALVLGFLALRKHSATYLGWSLLFFYILLDDSLQLHEKLGYRLSQQFHFFSGFNLRAEDFGELIISGSVGLFFLIFIATAYRYSDSLSRKISRYLIRMLFALAVCGIVFDMMHTALNFRILRTILALLEDGGEMIVMSVIASFVFFLPERIGSAPLSNSLDARQEVLSINQSINR